MIRYANLLSILYQGKPRFLRTLIKRLGFEIVKVGKQFKSRSV